MQMIVSCQNPLWALVEKNPLYNFYPDYIFPSFHLWVLGKVSLS